MGFNTAKAIAHLFNILKKINSIHNGNFEIEQMEPQTFERMKSTFQQFVQEVLGLMEEKPNDPDQLLDIVLGSYREAKAEKNYNEDYSHLSSLKAGDVWNNISKSFSEKFTVDPKFRTAVENLGVENLLNSAHALNSAIEEASTLSGRVKAIYLSIINRPSGSTANGSPLLE